MTQAKGKRAVQKAVLDGREFEIHDAGEDMRVLTAMAVAQDSHASETRRVQAFSKIMELYFGDVETALDAQDAFAAEHGGACGIEDFMTWLNGQIGSVKN